MVVDEVRLCVCVKLANILSGGGSLRGDWRLQRDGL